MKEPQPICLFKANKHLANTEIIGRITTLEITKEHVMVIKGTTDR